jgi:hypothetical protein
MNPATQHLIPLLYAAGISAIGWLMPYMPEPAPGFYIYLLRRQRKPFVEFCRLTGRVFGLVFAAWTVLYFVLTIVDLLP